MSAYPPNGPGQRIWVDDVSAGGIPSADSREPAEGSPGRTAKRGWLNALTSALALAFVTVAIVISWPQSLGGPFRMVVVSGVSMQPWLHTGDLVLAVKRSSYEVGDAIVYTATEDGEELGRVVHRIIEVNPDGTYVTQGDNKTYRDPWNVETEWVNGEVILMIPKAYYVLSIWRHPFFLAAISGLFLTMALWPRDPLSDPPAGPAFRLPPPEPKRKRRRQQNAQVRVGPWDGRSG